MEDNVQIIGQAKTACKNCCKPKHPFNTKCHYNDLILRIGKLLEANSYIPHILEANKEATELANTFRKVAKDTTKAISICEKVVMEFENGKEIWDKFKERLEAEWPAKTTAQGTEESHNPSAQKSTIPSETGSKPSIEETPVGETIALDFSPRTQDATPVENAQQ